MTDQPTQTSYDEVPYPSVPRRQTHPNHLAALARLFGMSPAPVERCRVLDLGCGDGSNLIPMAYQLPESEFVGIDLSPHQIAAGQAAVASLGLKNITLDSLNLLDVDAALGQFDYIIVYGVYSWVPPEVQDKILEICKQNLAPNGVAYVSYNVYPGWHMHGIVREMMLYHIRQVDEPYARVNQGRALLDFLVETVPTLSSNLPNVLKASSLILEDMQELLRQQPDEYLFHDHLEEINEPVYLHQFVERTEGHGLQYLIDAESSAMLSSYLPAQLSRSLREMAKTDLEVEQFMDFLYMRAFRQTLLCHQDVSLNRDIKLDNLARLHVASPARPVADEPDIHAAEEEKFRSPIGTTIATSQPLNKAALLYLTEVWPQPVPFDRLLAAARARLNPDASPVYSAAALTRDAQQLGDLLLKGYALNLVELHAYTPHFTLEISESPVVSALARFQAQDGQQVTNQRHEIITLEDEVSHYLLPYLDGKHNRVTLLEVLAGLVAEGVLVVQSNGQSLKDAGRLRDTLAQVLDRSLHKLARDALLVG